MKHQLLKNTIILLLSTFIIRVIGFIVKIVQTRMLGPNGISIYVLSYPTILLFITLSSLSLNQSLSKLVSEAKTNNKMNESNLLKSALLLSLKVSTVLCIVYLLTIKFISHNLLHKEELYLPLKAGALLIFVTGPSDALRGFFNGKKEMSISSFSHLLEQIVRSFFGLLFLFLFYKKDILIANTLLILSLSLGEISSILYSIIKIKKKNYYHPTKNNKHEKLQVRSLSFTLTIGKMIGSITYFLEPLIYTLVLTRLGYKSEIVHLNYTKLDAYVFPMFTTLSFLPQALSTSIIPHISESAAVKDYKKIKYYFYKLLRIIFIPSIAYSCLLFFYGGDFLHLFYKTTFGKNIIQNACLCFIAYYIQGIITSILQSTKSSKKATKISCFCNILRIFLIILFSFIPKIRIHSLLISVIITLNLNVLLLLILFHHDFKVKFSIRILLSYANIFLFLFSITLLQYTLGMNYLIVTFVLLLFSVYFLRSKTINKELELS